MRHRLIALISLTVLVTACGTREYSPEENRKLYKVGNPYTIAGQRYHPKEDFNYDETGLASWYGPGFHRNDTANGEQFNKYSMTAAHKTLPMPSVVRVTNLENGRSVKLRVNDRGPFVKDRIIDVSKRAAEQLGFLNNGVAKVRVQLLPQETAALFGGTLPNGHKVVLARNDAPEPVAKPEPQEEAEEIQLADTDNTPAQPVFIGAETVSYEPDAALSATGGQPGDMLIRVGLFRQAANAKKVVRDISRFGVANVKEIVQDNERFYLVQLGPVTSAREAERLLNLILDSGYPDAYIIKS